MSTEEISSTLQLLPDHAKDTARQKFKELSGLAQIVTEEIAAATEKAQVVSSDIIDKAILTSESVTDYIKSRAQTNPTTSPKQVDLKPAKPTNEKRFNAIAWINTYGPELIRLIAIGLLIYFMGYFQWSAIYILIAVATFHCHQIFKESKQNQLHFSRDIVQEGEEKAIKRRVDELQLPSWFQFPDIERVEWLNKIAFILWPHLTTFMEKLIRQKIEPIARETLDAYRLWGFKFDKINFGKSPPRFEGLKVYNTSDNNEIVMDVEVSFASAANSRVSIVLMKIGASLSEIIFKGNLRIIMKPVLDDLPFIGGIQIFFLGQPTIDFDLGGAAHILDLPGINGLLKSALDNAIAEQIVNPNRLSIMLTDKISPIDVKMPKPIGVLVVEVVEAKNLPKMDLGFSSCDPYVIIAHGHYEEQTKVASGTNPVWKETLAFPIEIPESVLDVVVLDKDTLSGDDLIGKTKIQVDLIIKADGYVDTWVSLRSENHPNGQLHLRLSWLDASTEPPAIETTPDKDNYTAILTVFLDSVQTRPIYSDVPEVCVCMDVGNCKPADSAWILGRDPVFQEGHIFLLKKSFKMLTFTISDMAEQEEELLAKFEFPLTKLFESPTLGIGLQSHELPEWKGRIRFAAQLKYLRSRPGNEDRNSNLKKAFDFYGSSRRVMRNLGSVRRNMKEDPKIGRYSTIRPPPIPPKQSSITTTTQTEPNRASRQQLMETNFDYEPQGNNTVTLAPEEQDKTKIQGSSGLPRNPSLDEHDVNANNQHFVRRRLSEGLKSLSFRK